MGKQKIKISVVIPCYKCSFHLNELHSRLVATLSDISSDYEIILVNDQSPENDWEVITELAEKDKKVIGINFARNFGQHYAITAGLDYCSGDWVVVMDGDLQDQPEEIIKMYNKANEGYDIVAGIRKQRKDFFLKRFCSKLFYFVFNYLTDQEFDNRVANYGIYSKKVIDSIKLIREQNRNFSLFVLWSGFKRAEIDIEHAQRTVGASAYNFQKLLNLAFDSIVAHSNKLLKLTVKLGLFTSLISFFCVIWLVLRYFFWGLPVAGWTSMVASLYLTTGVLIFIIGVVGIYVGKIFDEVKNRPLYIVSESVNVSNEAKDDNS